MRKIVYQTKKFLSAILATAMVFTVAPVNVLAEENVEVLDKVEVINEATELSDSSEILYLDDGEEFDKYIGGIASFDPNGGTFNKNTLVARTEGEKKYIGEVNAYSKCDTVSGNRVVNEDDEILDEDGDLKADVDFTKPLYYKYGITNSGRTVVCVNYWEDIVPVKEGYRFAGWFEMIDGKITENPFPYGELTEADCVDKTYGALWREDRYLPSIADEDISAEVIDKGKTVKFTLKIDQSVFNLYDPNTEDLYVLRVFGSDKPNDNYNWGPKTYSPDGYYWQWNRWGDGAWDMPIKPGTEQIEIIGYFYNDPVQEVVNTAITLQYFTCKKGAGGLSSSYLEKEPKVITYSVKASRADAKLLPNKSFSVALSDRFFEYSGKEIKPKVTARDGSTALKENVDFAVAYVDNLDAGTGMAIVSGKGAYEDIITKLMFFIKQKSLDTAKNIKVVFSKAGTQGKVNVYNGKVIIPEDQYVASLKDNDINDIKDAASYEVVITFKDDSKILKNYILDGDSDKKEISRVFQKAEKDFASAFTVELDETVSKNGVTYTGKAIKPAVKVVDNETKEEALKRFYTVAYKDNTNVGTAKIIVTGKNGYVGSVEKEFTINKKDTITDVNVADVPSAVYTGKAYAPKPKVTAKVDGRLVTLKSGKDYNLAYSENVNVGTGKVSVVFNNYDFASITKEFQITQAEITSVKMVGNYYPGVIYNKYNCALTVKAGKTTLSKDDYQIVNTAVRNDGKIYITVKALGDNVKDKTDAGITVSKKLTKENLKNMGDTYKRVVYYGETYSLSGNYLSSKADGIKLFRDNATVTGDMEDEQYVDITKFAIGKTVPVKWSVSRNDARYTGSKTIKIKYAAKNIADDNVGLSKYEISSNAIPAQSYTGKAVTISKEELKKSLKNSPENSLYDIENILETAKITYANNKKKSTAAKPAYVVIQGKGKFTGKIKIPFVIK